MGEGGWGEGGWGEGGGEGGGGDEGARGKEGCEKRRGEGEKMRGGVERRCDGKQVRWKASEVETNK